MRTLPSKSFFVAQFVCMSQSTLQSPWEGQDSHTGSGTQRVGRSGHSCEITKGWKPTTKRLFLRIPQQFITDLAFNWIFLKPAHECCLQQNSLKLIVPGVDMRSWAKGSKPQKHKSPGLPAHCPISNRGSGHGV